MADPKKTSDYDAIVALAEREGQIAKETAIRTAKEGGRLFGLKELMDFATSSLPEGNRYPLTNSKVPDFVKGLREASKRGSAFFDVPLDPTIDTGPMNFSIGPAARAKLAREARARLAEQIKAQNKSNPSREDDPFDSLKEWADSLSKPGQPLPPSRLGDSDWQPPTPFIKAPTTSSGSTPPDRAIESTAPTGTYDKYGNYITLPESGKLPPELEHLRNIDPVGVSEPLSSKIGAWTAANTDTITTPVASQYGASLELPRSSENTSKYLKYLNIRRNRDAARIEEAGLASIRPEQRRDSRLPDTAYRFTDDPVGEYDKLEYADVGGHSVKLSQDISDYMAYMAENNKNNLPNHPMVEEMLTQLVREAEMTEAKMLVLQERNPNIDFSTLRGTGLTPRNRNKGPRGGYKPPNF